MANITTNAKDIVVIDTSEAVGALSQLFRGFAGLSMISVKTMTATVSAQVITNQADIRGLRIIDHGNLQGCEIGNDFVTTANFSSYLPDLLTLKGCFCPYTGFAHFLNCLQGQNTALMYEFARWWNVPVYAGEWYTNALGLNMYAHPYKGLLTFKAIPDPFLGFQQWVRVDPSGTVTRNVSVP
jgi:hypothetical protein